MCATVLNERMIISCIISATAAGIGVLFMVTIASTYHVQLTRADLLAGS